MHDPYHPAGRPRADEQPAARRATPVRIRHMRLHFGAIGRGLGDARRCPRGARPRRADEPDGVRLRRLRRAVSANAGRRHARRLARRASQRGAARRGAETSKRAGTISSSHRRDSADRRERHRFRTHGMPRARVAMRRGTAGRHAASRRDSARRRARVPRISAIDPAPPPQAVPFHRRAALRQAGTSRPPFRSFQEMHRSKLPAQSFPFAHRRPFPL
ncbi:hypothetical protein BBQ_1498 [Burkholderia pseudomallei MSHR511]|nr:hypothetical protein BBS_3108 [Burkholderia pseudomallei NAU20B-16]AHG32825.1 hypothetical protein BBQ_1498 [Burkholderia pseudomallei MSHR511]AHG68153.1 hypothetical protein BBN_1624 [Burkholderia pseudomallei MSHR146]